MSDLTIGRERAGTAARSASDLYRAVWRWHFYAGLFVLPFLIILAVTGALYLFRGDIEPVIHADLMRVERSGRCRPHRSIGDGRGCHPGSARHGGQVHRSSLAQGVGRDHGQNPGWREAGDLRESL